MPYAMHISSVTNLQAFIFGGMAPNPIDGIAPEIGQIMPADQTPVTGQVQFTFSVFDAVGIKRIGFTFGNGDEVTTTNFENPVFEVDTTAYSDGAYDVTISVTNINDKVTTETIGIFVSNDGTTINGLNPGAGQVVGGTHTFSANVVDPFGIATRRFHIGPRTVTSLNQTGTGYATSFNTTELVDGEHDFRVYVESNIGQVSEETVTFRIDNTPPVVSNFPFNNGDFLEGIALFDLVIQDDSEVVLAELFVDGELEVVDLHQGAVAVDTEDYPEGQRVLTLVVADEVGNTETLTREVVVDNKPPEVNIWAPLDGRTVSSSFSLRWDEHDEGGFGEPWVDDPAIDIYVGGTLYAQQIAGVGQTRINIENRPPGWNVIEVVATDASGKSASDSIELYFDHDRCLPDWDC